MVDFKSLGKKNKFSKKNDKFLMMQFGKTYLNPGDAGKLTSRIVPDLKDSQWQWCVREKVGNEYKVTHWFGFEFGMELLVRAISEGNAINTFFYEKEGEYQGNARINVKEVITPEELALAIEAAENEVWLEDTSSPAPKTKAKQQPEPSKQKVKSPFKAKLEEAEEEEETEDDEGLY